MKKIILAAGIISIGLISINAIKKGEPKDSLDKRIFTVTMTEVKEGSPPKKGVEDELEFKAGSGNGKGMFSNFLMDKYELKWMKYEITKDSVYVDEDQSEGRYIEAEVSTTDASDQTMSFKCVVDNYDISGEIKITKKDKLKKKYEFSGKEKPKEGKKK